jgi:hypothetical protein
MMIRNAFFSVATTLLFTCCAMAATPRVLILGDGGSQTSVAQALQDAGDNVTVVEIMLTGMGLRPRRPILT